MRWPSWRVQAEPEHSWQRHAWQIYVEALGADRLLENEAEIEDLRRPEPNTEGERMRRRSEQVTRLRAHVSALRSVMYPADEDPADG